MKISRKSFIWLALVVTIFIFLRKPVEGFQGTGKPSAPGCPCAVAEDCYTLSCKGGKCGNIVGQVPEKPMGECTRKIPSTTLKYTKLNNPGCSCSESAQCSELLCRDGKCVNAGGVIPTIVPTPENCPINL